jgi:hypothetical protein
VLLLPPRGGRSGVARALVRWRRRSGDARALIRWRCPRGCTRGRFEWRGGLRVPAASTLSQEATALQILPEDIGGHRLSFHVSAAGVMRL